MALSVTIDGTDQVGKLKAGTMSIVQDAGNNEAGADFTLIGYGPEALQSVVIADGATTYFSGETRGYQLSETVPGNWYAAVNARAALSVAPATIAPFALSDMDPTETYESMVGITAARIPSPYAMWRLGESAGVTAVDARAVRDGTYVGAPTLGVTGALTGIADTAVTFDGGTQWVDCGAAMLAGQANFSIAAWVKTSYKGAKQAIYCEQAVIAGNPLIQFVMDTTGRPLFSYRDNAGTLDNVTPTSGDWADGTWHHMAMRKAGTAVSVLVDGVSVRGQTLTANDTLTGTLVAKIGKQASAGWLFHGSLDEVTIWRTGLSLTEVAGLYNTHNTKRYRSLTFTHTYESGKGTTDGGVVVTTEPGLEVGNVIGIGSVNFQMALAPWVIQEIRVTFDVDGSPVYAVTYGDPPLHLHNAFA